MQLTGKPTGDESRRQHQQSDEDGDGDENAETTSTAVDGFVTAAAT